MIGLFIKLFNNTVSSSEVIHVNMVRSS